MKITNIEPGLYEVEAEFFTKVYGSAPAKTYQDILLGYIEGKINKELLSFAELNKKKSQEIDQMVIDILCLFHRNGGNEPVIGNWMFLKCLTNTGKAIFNAQKNKMHPKKDLIDMAIVLIEPYHIQLFRGKKVVLKPDGVDTYAVTIPTKPGQKGRSFFKAYEYVNPGVEFTFRVHFDEDMINPDLIPYWIEKAGLVGAGAYRERFGKFK